MKKSAWQKLIQNIFTIPILMVPILISCFFTSSLMARPPINIFKPSDFPLIPRSWPDTRFEFMVGFETSVSSRAFQDDCDERGCVTAKETRVNPLQLYHTEQNLLAGLKGFSTRAHIGQLSQLFNIDDENEVHGFYIPNGAFKVPVSLFLTARFHFTPTFDFAVYIPYYQMELSDVRWCHRGAESLDDTVEHDVSENELQDIVSSISHLDLSGWKRKGFGDTVLQLEWTYNFWQRRPYLRNVRPQIRLGLNVPTGLRADENKLLAFSFGCDGSWGVQIGGGLGLTFTPTFQGGFDFQFLNLFGSSQRRRVRVDTQQTDLLLFATLPTFRDFGLQQQYNLYLQSCWQPGLLFRVDYQLLKRNEDRLTVLSDKVDPIVVNDSESLQEWTAHSLIFDLAFDMRMIQPQRAVRPILHGWFKWGFNGKRAILLDTVGVRLTLDF